MSLAGKHVLVTAGPTHEPIDPVRVIANRSSGRQGFAIAAAAAEAGAPARVTVTVLEEAHRLMVQVADTGPGLDAARVTDAFRRGWSTKTTTAAHGRGLGLALVGQVVSRLGGTVTVANEGGAVFRVCLPLPTVRS